MNKEVKNEKAFWKKCLLVKTKENYKLKKENQDLIKAGEFTAKRCNKLYEENQKLKIIIKQLKTLPRKFKVIDYISIKKVVDIINKSFDGKFKSLMNNCIKKIKENK